MNSKNSSHPSINIIHNNLQYLLRIVCDLHFLNGYSIENGFLEKSLLLISVAVLIARKKELLFRGKIKSEPAIAYIHYNVNFLKTTTFFSYIIRLIHIEKRLPPYLQMKNFYEVKSKEI